MKWVALALGGCLASAAAVSAGDVNCAQVNRYLQTGRSVTDVAETMVIAEEDIRKCQEQAKQQGEGTTAPDAQASGEAAKKE